MLSKRWFLLASICIASSVSAVENQRFSKTKPWCEIGLFGKTKKESPEIRLFESYLNTSPERQKIPLPGEGVYLSDLRYAAFQINELELLKRAVTTEPFGFLKPSLRAKLISWRWVHWGFLQPLEDPKLLQAVIDFVNQVILDDLSFSVEDLELLRYSYYLFSHTCKAVDSDRREQLDELDRKIEQKIYRRRIQLAPDKAWGAALFVISGSSAQPPSLQKLLDVAEFLTQALKDKKVSPLEAKKSLSRWTQDLKRINPVYFLNALRVFGVFRNAALNMNLSEDDFESIRGVFRSVVLKSWKNHQSAQLAAESELAIPLVPRPLPE